MIALDAEEVCLLAPAKLTTKLKIAGRRADGYHLLEAEMVSVSLYDEVRLFQRESLSSSRVSISDPGGLQAMGFEMREIPQGSSNLVTRALALAGVQADIELVKRIPPGAGLGGGSADAAAVLRRFGHRGDVAEVAALGADVPFCLQVDRAKVRGIGEDVERLENEKARFVLFLVPVLSPTKAVYHAFDELGVGAGATDCDGRVSNDLEVAALSLSPTLARYRDFISSFVIGRPQMAGSGSTFFVPGDFASHGLGDVHLASGIPSMVFRDGSLVVLGLEVREVTIGEVVATAGL